MFAYTYSKYGGPDVLERVKVPTPTPKENEVLIRIHATTVSSADWRVRSLTVPAGMGLIARLMFGIRKPRKPTLGTDLSGVVEAVGAKVTNFKAGDAVIGFPGVNLGAHAEFITMPATGNILPKPDNLSFEKAAAVPFGGTTAYDYLINKGQLRAGEKVLVNGASGAVGSACVQIAKHYGAEVTGVCSSSNVDLVKALGADHVIDYQTQDFADGSQKYDIVVDTVGTAPWARSRHALQPQGRMLLISGSTSDMIFGGLKARLHGKRLISGVASEAFEVFERAVELAAQGHLNPVIDRCYDFSQMVQAHAHVDTGRKTGSVVVKISAAKA